jgi:hypothetical protein
VIDEALQRFIWKFVFIGKIKIVEDLVELRAICIGELVEDFIQLMANAFGLFLYYVPSAISRNLKAMIVIGSRNFFVMIFLKNFFIFFVP